MHAVTPYFSFSLWERCSVETVGECPNVPSFTSGNRDTPCTDREAVQATTAYYCTQTNSQPILDALSANSDCQFYTTSVVNDCGQRNGEFCLADAFLNSPTVLVSKLPSPVLVPSAPLLLNNSAITGDVALTISTTRLSLLALVALCPRISHFGMRVVCPALSFAKVQLKLVDLLALIRHLV